VEGPTVFGGHWMDVVMPQLGETVTEGTVTRWYKKVGDPVKADEALFDVETDKVSTEIPAPATGVLAEILVAEGVTAKVGTKLAVIREEGGAPAAVAEAGPAARVADPRKDAPSTLRATVPPTDSSARLSPVVRKLIAEHGLDPAEIRGSGRDGRVTREDVLEHIAARKAAAAAAPAVRTEAPARSTADAVSRKVPFNATRRKTAEHMAKSWAAAPHVLQAVEADFHRVEEARRTMGAQWKQREGFSLTYLPFIARAVSIALGKYPNLNATFDGDGLVLHGRIHLGIAVDLGGEGLIVPVVKDVPSKSLPQIAREIHDLAVRARAGRLRPDDVTGGTYTISNNGAFGTWITAPIINPPQVAILSTDAVMKKPVVIESPDGDSIGIRPVGVLAQTFDHRAVDGAYSAAFLRELKAIIETRHWSEELQA
jgi:pyruvate dehydrogenase E2 component (dihydrolipoamide acetyltransferase)